MPFCGTSIYVFSGPSLTYNGGNECTATLHSSDRDPTLRLHLHLANSFMIFRQNWHCSEPPDHSSSYSKQTFFQDYTLSTNIFVTTTTKQANILSSAPHHIPNSVKTLLYQRAFPTFTNFFCFFLYIERPNISVPLVCGCLQTCSANFPAYVSVHCKTQFRTFREHFCQTILYSKQTARVRPSPPKNSVIFVVC
jgi:hypothetical protein